MRTCSSSLALKRNGTSHGRPSSRARERTHACASAHYAPIGIAFQPKVKSMPEDSGPVAATPPPNVPFAQNRVVYVKLCKFGGQVRVSDQAALRSCSFLCSRSRSMLM